MADFSLENGNFLPFVTAVSVTGVLGKFWYGVAVFSLYHVRYCSLQFSFYTTCGYAVFGAPLKTPLNGIDKTIICYRYMSVTPH